ncbi:MAG TPA: hypothetical protein VGR50_05120 [Terriglobales bacterium]|nr:hypothetical protein [Terriglobales bacterium]
MNEITVGGPAGRGVGGARQVFQSRITFRPRGARSQERQLEELGLGKQCVRQLALIDMSMYYKPLGPS